VVRATSCSTALISPCEARHAQLSAHHSQPQIPDSSPCTGSRQWDDEKVVVCNQKLRSSAAETSWTPGTYRAVQCRGSWRANRSSCSPAPDRSEFEERKKRRSKERAGSEFKYPPAGCPTSAITRRAKPFTTLVVMSNEAVPAGRAA